MIYFQKAIETVRYGKGLTVKHSKKMILVGVCAILCASVFSQINADCITLRMFDGGVSAGCGAALVGTGFGTILIPGFLFHAFAHRTGSTFFGLCACASYLSGIIMVAGGAKIVCDGIKKLFGFNQSFKRKKEPTHSRFVI